MPTSGQTTIMIDAQESVLSISNTPPILPVNGDRYLIGTTPTGAWASYSNYITEYTGGWSFTAPSKGMRVWIEDIVEMYNYDTSWTADRYYVRNVLEKLTGNDRLNADYIRSGLTNRILLATEIGTSGTAVSAANKLVDNADTRMSDARTPLSHTHGNITNVGAISSTADLPIKTGTSGVLEAGAFGTTSKTFCEGNDSRLPTDDEKDALIGTSGTSPSSTNKFVDDSDNRMLKTITKRAYLGVTGLDDLEFDLPEGSLIFRFSLTNETALTSDDGATSYDVNLAGGSTETLVSSVALTQDTEASWNGFVKTFGLTYAEIVPDSGSFSDGQIVAQIQYLEPADTVVLVDSIINTHQATFDLVSDEVTLTISPDSDLHLNCGTEKTLVLDEEVWDDLPPVNLLTASVGSSAPTITTLPDGRSAKAMTFDLNDFSYIQSEITHAFKESSELEIHVHWGNNGSHATESRYVNFEMKISIAKPGQIVGSEATYTTGNLEIPALQPFTHYVSSFSANIPATDIRIGDLILGQFKRIDPTGGVSGPASNPFVFQVGFHGKIDTLGSRQVYIK